MLALRRPAVGLMLAAMVLGACGMPEGGDAARPARPGALLYLHTAESLVGLDTATGEVRVNAVPAVPSPRWSTLVAAVAGPATTIVSELDPITGNEWAARELRGRLQARVVSTTGRLVALSEPRAEGTTLWLPEGRAQTKLVVASSDGAGEPRVYQLDGNFEPEAFSTNDRKLFLIQYVPAMHPDRYRVRVLKLGSGKVVPVGRRVKAAPDEMRGTGRRQVFDADGSRLYTLYTRQPANYTHREPAVHRDGMVHAFVHVLDLGAAWAHCVDLPMPFGTGKAAASAIALSDDQARVYVVDWSGGAIAAIDTKRLRVTAVESVDLGAPDDETFATVAGDTLYVGGNSSVVALDAATLDVVSRWKLAGEVAGLEATADGETLYVGLDDLVLVMDPSSGRVVRSIPAPGTTGLEHLIEATA